jgi:hypothetical protein
LSIRFQADNDLKFAIVRAVRQREPAIDFCSAADAGLNAIPDPEILQCARLATAGFSCRMIAKR